MEGGSGADMDSEESVFEYDSFEAAEVRRTDNFTPVCNKISSVLNDLGFSTVQLIPSDVHTETNSISLIVIESWADTILCAVQELADRLNNQKKAVMNASFSKRLGEVSNDSILAKNQELRAKILEFEKREKSYESRISILESSKAEKTKATTTDDVNTRKTVKNLELQMQECERRARQKEIELNKLKAKLQGHIERERETAAKNRKIFAQYKQGDISFDSKPSPVKKANTSHNTSSSSSHSHSAVNTSTSSSASVNSVLEALEEQRSELVVRCRELELQVRDLSAALKDAQNGRGGPLRDEVEDEAAGARGGGSSEEPTPTARAMYARIVEQQQTIEQLQARVEVSRMAVREAEEVSVHLRARVAEQREQNENLRLELESRPSMKQWAATKREFQEMEDKLQDLTVMRGDSAEIANWRKHLSTQDRIKIDKRNHELGLWLLDSLPKTVMKETLQAVCRELDVTDISDVLGCVVKLKAVVKTVPRMERFISQACSYVFQRDPTLDQKIAARNGGGRPKTAPAKEPSSMEDLFPMLKKWWNVALKSFDHEEFNDRVLEELHRREHMLTSVENSLPGRRVDSEAQARDLKEQWVSVGRLQWGQRDPVKTLQVVRDLVDFQVEVMQNKQSLMYADEFVRERPEVIVNRIVSHVQYIFEVRSLDGVLPRMNQVYLFTEEMRNFLATVRAILANEGGLSFNAAVPNALLLAEVERRVTMSCARNV